MAVGNINELPENILLELFTHVPARQLLLRCRPVCSLWRDLIDLVTLWKRKCLREGFITEDWDQPVADWKIFYFLRSLQRNLLHNPCAEEGFEFWSLDVNGGDEWKVEELSKDQRKEFPNDQVKKYFVTSYYTCLKSQVVDLKAEGYWEELMDTTRPDIEVKDWFAARPDCGSKYQLCVQLLSSAHAPLGTFQPDPVMIQQKSDAKWRECLRRREEGVKSHETGVTRDWELPCRFHTHSPTIHPASATSGFSTEAWTLTTGPAGTAPESPTAVLSSGPRCPDAS
ncbi:F-box only protein 44 isoform X2 [Grammomys surdaster]|nr:F-box only protein 44 isoform X2 [Grammomys surdaster]XP_028613687.1 F-box only protein 44 isoform X2 [Grammomys surdaster]XP_028613688.1 F-box only protein 44 isoform X2 [Grammomys surdaster]